MCPTLDTNVPEQQNNQSANEAIKLPVCDKDNDSEIAIIYIPEPSKRTWSWWNLTCALVSIPFCCLYGSVATVATLLAYLDHKAKDNAGYRHKLSIAHSFVVNTFFFVGILVVYAIVCFVIYMLIQLVQSYQIIETSDGATTYGSGPARFPSGVYI